MGRGTQHGSRHAFPAGDLPVSETDTRTVREVQAVADNDADDLLGLRYRVTLGQAATLGGRLARHYPARCGLVTALALAHFVADCEWDEKRLAELLLATAEALAVAVNNDGIADATLAAHPVPPDASALDGHNQLELW